MLDINAYLSMTRIEDRLNQHGFDINRCRYHTGAMAVYAREDKWPIFARDAELYSAITLDQLSAFIDGIEFCKNYLRMIDAVDDDRICRCEQDIRNQKLVDQLTTA